MSINQISVVPELAMDNGTSIRNFDCLTAGNESLSRDIGALLPNDNPLTCNVGALSGNVKNSSANHFCCPPTGHAGLMETLKMAGRVNADSCAEEAARRFCVNTTD